MRWGWWNYVAYGSVNGLLLIYSQATLAARYRMWQRLRVPAAVLTPARIGTTFLVLVMTVPLARATSMPEALHIYSTWLTAQILDDLTPATPHIAWATVVPLILVLVVADVIVLRLRLRLRLRTRKAKAPPWLIVPVICACVAVIAWHALSGEPTPPFVYFRF